MFVKQELRLPSRSKINWPFPSFPGPLYQNEVKCSTFDMEMIFQFHANITHFHKKLKVVPHFESECFWNLEVAYSTAKLRNLCSAQQMESKTVPRRGFRILCQWILDSGFQSLVGFRIPLAVFRISKPGFSDSTRKTPRRAVFPGFRNLDSLCIGWSVGCRSLTKCFKNYMWRKCLVLKWHNRWGVSEFVKL